MSDSNNFIIREGDIVTLNNCREYQYQPLDETKDIINTFKGYNIQTVNIQPGDVILLHLNDNNIDVETMSTLLEEMSKIFPENTIIPVNELVLKGMTILRGAQSVNLPLIDHSLEETYQELFKNDYWCWQGGSK